MHPRRRLSAILFGALALLLSTSSAFAQVIATSKFQLEITDPCEVKGKDGPTWCEKARFRLTRNADCKSFEPRGRHVIRYCLGPPKNTPCGDAGYIFSFGGLRYSVEWRGDDSILVEATNNKGKVVWSETAEDLSTEPNSLIHRTCAKSRAVR